MDPFGLQPIPRLAELHGHFSLAISVIAVLQTGIVDFPFTAKTRELPRSNLMAFVDFFWIANGRDG